MIGIYIVVLCISACFACVALQRITGRICLMLGAVPITAGLFATLSAITFLMVVSAPPMLLVAALILLVLGIVEARRQFLPAIASYGVPVIAVILGLASITFPSFTHVPALALLCVSFLAWLPLTLSANISEDAAFPGGFGLILAVLPITAAPFFGAPSYLALDAALLTSALLGLLLMPLPIATLGHGARGACVLLLGWLQLQSALHGGWPAAVISLAIWVAALGWHFTKTPDHHRQAHAF